MTLAVVLGLADTALAKTIVTAYYQNDKTDYGFSHAETVSATDLTSGSGEKELIEAAGDTGQSPDTFGQIQATNGNYVSVYSYTGGGKTYIYHFYYGINRVRHCVINVACGPWILTTG